MLSFEEVSEDSVGAFEVGNGAGDFEDGGHSCSCDSAGGLKSCSCNGCVGTRCRRTFSWGGRSSRRGRDSYWPRA